MSQYFVERTHCPICGGDNTHTLYSCAFTEAPVATYLRDFYDEKGGVDFDYLQGTDYVVEECDGCGFVYQKHIGNDELMGKLYDEWISEAWSLKSQLDRQTLDYFSRFAAEVTMLIAYFDKKPSDLSFMDFGMGWGYWCRMAAAFGVDTYGSDIADTRSDHAAKMGFQVIGYDDIANHQFDYINTDRVFEHLPNPYPVLQQLVRALRPDGLVKINVPNGEHIHTAVAAMNWHAIRTSPESLNPIAPLEHINCYNTAVIVTLAERVGLELVPMPVATYIKQDRQTYLFFQKRSS